MKSKEWLWAAAFIGFVWLSWKAGAKQAPPSRAPALKAEEVSATLTPATAQDVKAAFYNGWTDIHGHNPSDETTAMLLSHSALETGQWKSMYNWNPGNITTIHGKFFRLGGGPHQYRAYKTLDEGAKDMIMYLERKHKGAFDELRFGRPDLYARKLKASGYYEADEDDYASALSRIYSQFFKA